MSAETYGVGRGGKERTEEAGKEGERKLELGGCLLIGAKWTSDELKWLAMQSGQPTLLHTLLLCLSPSVCLFK